MTQALSPKVYKGYTRKQLDLAFDLVGNRVGASVCVDGECHPWQTDLVAASVEFFTGESPTLSPSTSDPEMVHVSVSDLSPVSS